MNASVQTVIERWFQGWSNLIAPARDGGLLNYIFQVVPSTQAGGSALLQLADSTKATFWSDLFIPLLLTPVQSVSVYQVINPSPASLQAIQSHPRHVLDMLLFAGMLLLFAFVLSVATIGLTCCCWWEHCNCVSVKRKSKLTVGHLQQLGQQPKFSVGSVRQALHNANSRTPIQTKQLRRDSESTASQDLYINCPKFRHCHPADLPELLCSSPTTIQARSNLGSRRSLTSLGQEKKQYLRSKSHTRNPDHYSHYTLLLFNILFLLLLIPCLTLAFYTMDSLFQMSNPSATGTQVTIQAAVMTLMQDMVTFMQDTIRQGEREMNRTVGILQNVTKVRLCTTVRRVCFSLQTELNNTAFRVVNRLLKSYNIQDVFDLGDQLSLHVQEINRATGYIRSNHTQTLQGLSNYAGELDAFRGVLLRSMRRLCDELAGTPKASDCSSQLTTARTLEFSFDSTKVNVNPSIILQVIIEKLNIDLPTMLNVFADARRHLLRMLESISENLQTEFRLSQFLSPLTAIWRHLENTSVVPFRSSVNRAQPTVNTYMNLITNLLSVTGYVVLVFYLALVVMQVTYLSLIAEDTKDRELYSDSTKRNKFVIFHSFVVCLIHQALLPIDGTEHLRVSRILNTNPIYGDRIARTEFTRANLRLRCPSVLLGIISLMCCFSLLVCLIIIPAVTLVNVDICRNFETPLDLNLTDRAIELFLQHEWPRLLSNETLSPSLLELIKIQPPRNLISVIATKCNPNISGNSSFGLLGRLGYQNVLNFQSVLQGAEMQKILKKVESKLVAELLKVDFSQLIPNDLDSLTGQARNISTVFDNVDYRLSINELSKQFLPVVNLSHFIQPMRMFVTTVPNSTNSRAVLSVLQLIEQSIPTYDAVVKAARDLAGQFQTLRANQVLTTKLNATLVKLAEARVILTDRQKLEAPIGPAFQESSKVFLQASDVYLEREFGQLVRVIIPCGKLYELFHLTMQMTCVDRSLMNRIGANCFFQLICTFLLILDLFVFVRLASRYSVQCVHMSCQHASLVDCVRVTFREWEHRRTIQGR
ncbi:hypothetical protein P879_00716 [Paragonimus westermani]|uniref:Prominin n=1 Tax=Paragonimus westermani TaxID=34504 RepID=A0A8T0DN46_9TREM|nr:hypothetical protein P879_00716 [Paragonimus westermani]